MNPRKINYSPPNFGDTVPAESDGSTASLMNGFKENPVKHMRFAAALAAVAAMAASVASAQDEKKATLKPGDKAPALTIEKWVKGDAVEKFENGKVYVVEFWATWCGPCIASMPHLTEVQKEYKSKGVTVISTTSEDPRNTLEKVEKMVKDKGDTMSYTVAWDKGRTTNKAFMEAAGQGGIPTAFIIDKTGTIAWIGHPMEMEVPLDMVVEGSWDSKKSPQELEKASKELQAALEKMQDDPKAGLAAFDAASKKYPKLAKPYGDMVAMVMLKTGDYDKAYSMMGKIVDEAIAAKDAQKLNQIAWTIVDPEGDVKKKDLEIAMKAAVKADEITGSKDAPIIDTLARVHFLKGDVKKAIELQKKAVGLAEGEMKSELEKSLKEYEGKSEKQ